MGFSYNIQYALIELLMFYGLGRNALVLDGYASQKIESVLNLGIHQFLQIYLDSVFDFSPERALFSL